MKAWACAVVVAGFSTAAGAADAPRPVRVYTYQDLLSADFARALTATLVVAGGFIPALEQQSGDQLSLVLGQNIKPTSADPSKIRYELEFRNADGTSLGFISNTCRKAKFEGCFGPIIAQAVQISAAMGLRK